MKLIKFFIYIFSILILIPAAFAEDTSQIDSIMKESVEYCRTNKFDRCIDTAKKALTIKPDLPIAYFIISQAYLALNKPELALAAAQEAMRFTPNNPMARNLNAIAMQSNKSFWDVPLLTGRSINFIDSPELRHVSLSSAVYYATIILTLCISCVLIILKRFNLKNLINSFLFSCATGALLFAARMDYGWLVWLKNDDKTLSKLNIEKRFLLLEGGNMAEFAYNLKKDVPLDARVRIYSGAEEYNYRQNKIKYHMLPLLISNNSNYIAVYHDPSIFYDPSTKILRNDTTVIANNVIMLKSYGDGEFLFKTGDALK